MSSNANTIGRAALLPSATPDDRLKKLDLLAGHFYDRIHAMRDELYGVLAAVAVDHGWKSLNWEGEQQYNDEGGYFFSLDEMVIVDAQGIDRYVTGEWSDWDDAGSRQLDTCREIERAAIREAYENETFEAYQAARLGISLEGLATFVDAATIYAEECASSDGLTFNDQVINGAVDDKTPAAN